MPGPHSRWSDLRIWAPHLRARLPSLRPRERKEVASQVTEEEENRTTQWGPLEGDDQESLVSEHQSLGRAARGAVFEAHGLRALPRNTRCHG